MDVDVKEYTYISLKDKYKHIPNVMIFIVAGSGWGKGLATEAMVEEFHRAGYVILCIADPKQELEMGFAEFMPKAEYHLENLRLVGKKAETKKVKRYHPFTFNIPKRRLPPFEFFTIPLKSLERSEWGLIAERNSDSDTMKN